MKEITISEMKKISLDILKDVAKYCDDNNLHYYICGGTLLGAVRHKGFIPWDDDIDILMPRPDYLKFVKSYNGSNKRYIVKSIENSADYWRTFAKVFDLHTYLEEDCIRVPKKDNGVFIDIFPVDGLPKSRIRQAIFFKEQEFLNFLYHGSAWNYTKSFKYADSKDYLAKFKGKLRTLLKYIAITILNPLPTSSLIHLINKNAMRFDYNQANEVAAIVDCHYGGSRERMPRKLFEKQIPFEFEKTYFWGSAAWKLYLRNMYGDFMELPPLKNRVTHHDFKAYWRRGEK
ncbi:LicD family protein [Acidaminococcus fermentans DSM 20731]|uniref:LicD family protein n=1 Tax=Acidaminococcus fermentans (strain ATCC 25085 / DSM 20731 / CCUG 9996 / CIP 106432 / VR4) TaxID=591001 RepID=D2RJ81_ACIFV|nr:LicD family protein [Acidaminococcus fermentans]ADB47133.1 LicD family protein [Acidaminococcus fermentans DSM 20731]UEA72263.1 LicD family protein [Acidaminococcus fermentans DSM 20731]